MLVHGIMITNNADHHDPEHHAEMTASKIIVTAESASPETVRASRALRRDVERILLRHHEDTHHCEQAALGEHGAARYDHPLHKDSAKTGHTTVCDTIMQDIVAAAHRHGLGRAFRPSGCAGCHPRRNSSRNPQPDARPSRGPSVRHGSRGQGLLLTPPNHPRHRPGLSAGLFIWRLNHGDHCTHSGLQALAA